MYFIKGKINFWSLKFSLGCMYIIEFPNSSISPLEFVFLVATLVSRPLYANSKEELTWYLFIIKNNFLNLLIIKLYIHTHIFHFFFFVLSLLISILPTSPLLLMAATSTCCLPLSTNKRRGQWRKKRKQKREKKKEKKKKAKEKKKKLNSRSGNNKREG